MSYQREFADPLRVAVIGIGKHAYRNVLPALHYLPVRLVALCDLNEALLARTGAEYGVSALYTDAAEMYAREALDAVFVCAGPKQHPTLVIQALNAGVHVWTEKPPAMRAHEVEAMIAARGPLVCAVGFKKAYMPATAKARELIALPEFGKLQSMLAIYPMTIPRDGAGILASGQYCNWLANGCHPLSLMLAVGGSVETVTTLRGPGDPAVGVVALQFASGAMGTFHLAGGSPPGHAGERYEFFGEKHAVSIENSGRVAYHRGIPFVYETQREFTAPGLESGSIVWEASSMLATLENKALFIQGIFQELNDFCRAIRDRDKPGVGTLEFALHIMRVYEAGLMSTGEPVAIKEDAFHAAVANR